MSGQLINYHKSAVQFFKGTEKKGNTWYCKRVVDTSVEQYWNLPWLQEY